MSQNTAKVTEEDCPDCFSGKLSWVKDLTIGEVTGVSGVKCNGCPFQGVDPAGLAKLEEAKQQGKRTH